MTKKMLATSSVALFLLAAIPSTFAFGGFGADERGQKYDSDTRAAVEAAIAAEDYSAFVAATGNSNLTEDQFAEMVARHSEMETQRAENEADREAIQTAIADGDYETWKELISAKNPDEPILEKITADNFAQLQEMQNLRKQMEALHDELGVGRFGFGPGGGEMDCDGMGGGHGKFGGPRGDSDE